MNSSSNTLFIKTIAEGVTKNYMSEIKVPALKDFNKDDFWKIGMAILSYKINGVSFTV